MPEKLYLGTARRNINPQVPISLAGYFNLRMWEKILDDIEVTALVLKQGETYSAIVQFALVNVSQELVDGLYREIADIKELSFHNMIITATHSHTAPKIRSAKPNTQSDYLSFVIRKASEALHDALANMTSGKLFSGMTTDSKFSFNRRYWMKDGTVVTNPGKLNPNIDRSEGKVDYEIPIIGVKSNGKWQVILANIVNHADTVGGNGVSGDWPGFMIRKLEAEIGGEAIVFPLIGCSGNINHFDVSTDRNQTCYAESEKIGTGYAETVGKALATLKVTRDCTMTVKSCNVVSGPREIAESELAEARAVLKKYEDIPNLVSGETLTSEDLVRKATTILKFFANGLLDMALDKTDRIFNLVFISLGSVCIISMPCEPFVEIGLEIKNKIFPDKLILVVSLSNGTGCTHAIGGYIPNPYNYGRGGYETTPRASSLSVKVAKILLGKVRSLT